MAEAMEPRIERRREEYVRALDEALQHIVERLTHKPEVRRIVLFGSYARGRRDLFTDLDLLVVMDSSLEFVRRTAELYGELAVGVDLDLLVYTPEEFARMRDTPLVRRAIETGQVLLAR